MQSIFPPVSLAYNHDVCSSFTQIRKYCVFSVKFSFLGIYTGTLTCIVKLLDEVCACHSKRVGDNKGGFPLLRNLRVYMREIYIRK